MNWLFLILGKLRLEFAYTQDVRNRLTFIRFSSRFDILEIQLQ
jgi:hypothetical protein